MGDFGAAVEAKNASPLTLTVGRVEAAGPEQTDMRAWDPAKKEYVLVPVVPKGTRYPTQGPVSTKYLNAACEGATRLGLVVVERSAMLRPEDVWEVVGGRLQRSFRDGRTSGPGFLEDQAFLVQGLLDLHEATFEPRWLAEAIALAEQGEALFGDPAAGGWFRSAADHEQLVAREKPGHDGAEPSGASVATLSALRIHAFTSDDRWREIAVRALRAHGAVLEQHPAALHEMLLALDFLTDDAPEVVLSWSAGGAPPAELVGFLRRTFLPNRALTGAEEGAASAALALAIAVSAGFMPAVGSSRRRRRGRFSIAFASETRVCSPEERTPVFVFRNGTRSNSASSASTRAPTSRTPYMRPNTRRFWATVRFPGSGA